MNIHELLKNELCMGEAEISSYFTIIPTEKGIIVKLRPRAHLESATHTAMRKLAEAQGGRFDEKANTWTFPKEGVVGSNPTPEVPCTSCGNDSENGGNCHREHFHVEAKGDALVCERKTPLKQKQAPKPLDVLTSLIGEALQVSEATVSILFSVESDAANYLFFVKPKEQLPADYQQQLTALTKQLGGKFLNKDKGWCIPVANVAPTIGFTRGRESTFGDPSQLAAAIFEPSTRVEGKTATQVEGDKETEVETEESYSLAASKSGLGELAPVLKDAYGNIIDGFHRKGESQDWHEITVPSIDTPVKLELARLASNFVRRKVTPAELTQRITFLIKAGLKPDEIAEKTGIGMRTIYKYMPQELKSPKMVEAGRKSQESRQDAATLDARMQLDKRKDSEEEVPRGTAEPGAVDKEAAFTEEASYLGQLAQCDNCKGHGEPLQFKKVEVNGKVLNLCPNCQEKEKHPELGVATPISPPASPQPQPEPEPSRVEAKMPAKKEVDFEEQGFGCPLCGRTVDEKAYEQLKKKEQAKLQQLFQEVSELHENSIIGRSIDLQEQFDAERKKLMEKWGLHEYLEEEKA